MVPITSDEGDAMAHTRKTIIRHMIDRSGASPTDIASRLNKDESFARDIEAGDVGRLTFNQIAVLADSCGYEVRFVGHGEELAYSFVDTPRESRDFSDELAAADNEFSGRSIAVTGALYGYDDDAQRRLMGAIGATWVDRVRVRSTDYLIRGSDLPAGAETRQIRSVLGAKRTVTKIVEAEDFRRRYLQLTGLDLRDGSMHRIEPGPDAGEPVGADAPTLF